MKLLAATKKRIELLRNKLRAAEMFAASLEEDEIATTRASRKTPPVVATAGESPQADGYGASIKQVRDALKSVPEVFSVSDVETWLSILGPPMERTKISQALFKLANTNEIAVVVKGGGRRASTYRLAA